MSPVATTNYLLKVRVSPHTPPLPELGVKRKRTRVKSSQVVESRWFEVETRSKPVNGPRSIYSSVKSPHLPLWEEYCWIYDPPYTSPDIFTDTPVGLWTPRVPSLTRAHKPFPFIRPLLVPMKNLLRRRLVYPSFPTRKVRLLTRTTDSPDRSNPSI